MRTSCDIDVFVREADLDRAMEALSENLSYRIGEISDHDVQIYTPNGQHIELHRNLIEDHRINQAAEVLAALVLPLWKVQPVRAAQKRVRARQRERGFRMGGSS